MARRNYTVTVLNRLNLLMHRVKSVETYAERHMPEIYEGFDDAARLARRKGMSHPRIILLTVVSIFSPVTAIRGILDYVDRVERKERVETAIVRRRAAG